MIWETETLRIQLVCAFMKVPNKKMKRFMHGAFDELIALAEGRIDSTGTCDRDDDVTKALWSDVELTRLYHKYNSAEYRLCVSTTLEGVDIVWKQIQDRTKMITDRVKADKQRNAPRGLVKAEWYT